MKSIILTIIAAVLSSAASGQISISGTVTEKPTGKKLPGATVTVEGTYIGTVTDHEGNYQLPKLNKGKYTLNVRYIGYSDQTSSLILQKDTAVDFSLVFSPVLSDEVVVSSTRAGEKSGMAYTNLNRKHIESNLHVQDLPYLLESTPSLVVTSDAGNGVGYTGVRIRGTDASRINVTINGVPLNDAESHNVYWVDLPDIAASTDNIQVQRGVGTSTNGASAFGGSINLKTGLNQTEPYLYTSGAYGSFNTYRTTASIGTGKINDRWNFEGRLSKISSDGYIDRASSDLKSFYIGAAYQGPKDQVALNIFSGKEITYQSWYGVPEAALDTNRTWNFYTYENQVDEYQQDHYQLSYTRELAKRLTWTSTFHYTYGRGFYEEFQEEDILSNYLLLPVVMGGDTISQSDLIRRKWLDNDFYGMTWSLNYHQSPTNTIIFGGAYNEYDGDHFGEVIWARYASNGFINHRYYENNGFKTDMNVFGKGSFRIGSKLNVFADLQYRNVTYRFTGIDAGLNPVPQEVELDFFNPKAGISYAVTSNSSAYLSFGVGNKEPSRDDYTESSVVSRPQHETLYDFELGFNHRSRRLTAGLNFYHMMYKNQLVLTGEINDVGNYTRTNIDDSYRQGIELMAGYSPVEKVSLSGNVTLSMNKIDRYVEFLDDYDVGGQQTSIYQNTDIAFSPNIVGFIKLTAKPVSWIEAALSGKYVGEQFLDNTSSDSRTIDAYLVNDFRLTFSLSPKIVKSVSLSLMANNIFDIKYESNGYTFGYIYGGSRTYENYYYPQAGRNYLIKMDIKF
jgi:iron complex outermembrane recepter protein